MNKKQFISDYIGLNWEKQMVINAWNDYAESSNPDAMIFSMGEFDYIFEGKKPLEIVDMVNRGKFSSYDNYFTYDNYGYLVSFNNIEDYNSPIDFDLLADFIIEVGDTKYESIEEDESFNALYNYCGLIYDKEEFRRVADSIVEIEGYDYVTDDWDDFGGIVCMTVDNINKINKLIEESDDNSIAIDDVMYVPEDEVSFCKICSITLKNNGNYLIGYFKDDVFFTEEISYLAELTPDIIDEIIYHIK